MSRRAILVALCLVFASPGRAWATAGETEWSAGFVTGRGPAGWAAGVEAQYLRDLTDFWAIGTGLRDRRFLEDLPEGSTALTADARLVVDALTWVPAVAAAVGPAWTRGGVDAFVRVEAALGYRPAREWGLVLRVGAEQEGLAAWDPRWTVGLGYVWYRGAGIGLDL